MESVQKAQTLNQLIRTMDEQGVTGAKRYDSVRRFIGMQARKNRTPVTGSFELTPLCNLDCKMCYVHLCKEQMNGAELLPVQTWIDIAQQAIDAGMMYVQLTGGECLTYPGFRELYLFLQEKGIQITVKTNGLLLCGDMLDFFRQHPPAEIGVSVYGADDDGYERVTGRRVYHQVMNNILETKKAGIPISISVTPSAYMTDGVRLLHVLKGYGLPWSINGGLMQPAPETGRGLAEASLQTYEEILRTANELSGHTIAPLCPEQELPEAGSGQNTKKKEISCAAGRSSFAINWQGYLQPCINLNEYRHALLLKGFEAVWKEVGEQLHELTIPIECHDCVYRDACFVCIAAHEGRAEKGHVCRDVCKRTRFLVSKGLATSILE